MPKQSLPKLFVLAFASLGLLRGLSAQGVAGSQPASASAPTSAKAADTATPQGVIQAMLDAANKGNYDAARKLCTPDWAGQHDFYAKQPGGDAWIHSWKKTTRDGKITNVEVKSEDVKGDAATVMVLITYQKDSAPPKPDTCGIKYKLKKLDGQWKCDGV